jgi:Zn-dependent protease
LIDPETNRTGSLNALHALGVLTQSPPTAPRASWLAAAFRRWRAHLYPGQNFREFGVPAILLALSMVTTTAIGARFMQNFQEGLPTVAAEGDLWPWPWLLAHPASLLLGWPFSLALLSILLAHEFGHYIACRIHGIRVTLPWVLPAPTLSGTAGAVIQIRSRIPNRSALMDVGIYGPLAGYIVSLGVIALGYCFSHPEPLQHAQPLVSFGNPLTLRLVHMIVAWFRPGVPEFGSSNHPVLVAGWIGLFITALNLIPGGQLDGGHILYAVSPRLHKVSTWVMPALLVVCGVFFWVGWLLWGLLLLIPAMRHHRVGSEQPLSRKRFLLAAAAVAVFALTFSIEPFFSSSIVSYFTR